MHYLPKPLHTADNVLTQTNLEVRYLHAVRFGQQHHLYTFAGRILTAYILITWIVMAVKKICSAMFFYSCVIVSQSSLKWDISTTVIYGQSAMLSCNGNGCMPTSIKKWIGGPTYDVLCFNNYSSNPSKYELMYNKTKSSFDLMIKSFSFSDADCTYTCACGFSHYTQMLKLDEIDFVYPLDIEEKANTIQEEGKLYIDMSMKVYPIPNCTVFYEDIVVPIDRKFLDIQEVGLQLFKIKLRYALSVKYQNCGANLSLSCKVRSLEYPLLQQRLDLCKDHPDVNSSNHVGMIIGISFGLAVIVLICVTIAIKRKNEPVTIPQEENQECLTIYEGPI